MRLPFLMRRRGERDLPDDLDLIDEEDLGYSRGVRAWRKANATLRIARRGWPGFTYHASAQAVGTLVALSIAYLVSLAAGLVAAVPVAVIASIALLVVVVIAMAFRLAPRQLLMARATELLDAEPGRIVETLKKIRAHRGNADWDESEWDLFYALWDLPEPRRTILAVRFGEPMTLADIADALGLSRERVRQLEGRAIEQVLEDAEERALREDGPDE